MGSSYKGQSSGRRQLNSSAFSPVETAELRTGEKEHVVILLPFPSWTPQVACSMCQSQLFLLQQRRAEGCFCCAQQGANSERLGDSKLEATCAGEGGVTGKKRLVPLKRMTGSQGSMQKSQTESPDVAAELFSSPTSSFGLLLSPDCEHCIYVPGLFPPGL